MTGPRIGSLCSGYGGLDMGVQAVYGGTVAWHVEYDRDPSKILAHHWPHIPNHGDVKTTDWANVEPVDILTAGYPCQPFSHAGKRKGTDDPRHLWPGVATAIRVLRPGLAVLENVAGHLSLGLDTVLGDLAEMGYGATWGVVRAADAGAPHGRARVFILAADAERPHGWAATRDGGTGRELLASPRRVKGATAPGGDRAPTAYTSDDRRDRGGPARTGRDGSPHLHLAPTNTDDRTDDGERSRPKPRRRSEDAPHRPGDPRRERDGDGLPAVEWGPYLRAIRRWEHVTGRPAPRPTEPGRGRDRLAAPFVEWLMGLPAGHVTAVPDLSRNAQLKALGNGVVPQQAALALRILAGMEAAA
jgi:DNA (cytosine-5)-methyltransferase 1